MCILYSQIGTMSTTSSGAYVNFSLSTGVIYNMHTPLYLSIRECWERCHDLNLVSRRLNIRVDTVRQLLADTV